ncbi:hypothetical protein BDA99DRAFT_536167 [Phascolomyces articulosus]|uniref:Uncharacterized protein n=1 Tax=Phascolomyces articulosus TaxID=60185 RepID=A0AAD5PF21_9FUNG|nr:hypothetical protein BDA99DRAFT_536167 [Phascolomyces articulosus]
MMMISTSSNSHQTSSFVKQWRRIFRTNITRRKSTSSNRSSDSNKSNKSVRFQNVDSIYYTHSSTEYDRTPAQEDTARPVLGQLYFIDTEDMDDQALVKNTNHNRQRSIQTIAIHIALRAMR